MPGRHSTISVSLINRVMNLLDKRRPGLEGVGEAGELVEVRVCCLRHTRIVHGPCTALELLCARVDTKERPHSTQHAGGEGLRRIRRGGV